MRRARDGPGRVEGIGLFLMPRNFHFTFSISVPHVRIQGAPDIHVNQGSAINLTCIISYSPEPPAFVFWYRGNKESTSDRNNILHS